jgi:Raf kinase inhibitor-like YbhB/YbcL family protein
MLRKVCYLLIAFILLYLWQNTETVGGEKSQIKVKSTAFEEGGMIPKRYTCDGRDISPPLAWASLPEGTKSIALICEDLNARMGTRVLWVLFNLPPDMKELPENVPAEKNLANGAMQGVNESGIIGYEGPCPCLSRPKRRINFKVYALDTEINFKAGITARKLLKAMKGHILAEGQLMGKYFR